MRRAIFFAAGRNIIPIPDYQMALRPDNIGVVQDHVRETSWENGFCARGASASG